MKTSLNIRVAIGAAALLAAGICGSATAATVDLVPYLALKAGKWGILQTVGSSTLSAFAAEEGPGSGQIHRRWYENKGSGWTGGEGDIFEITADELRLVGSDDGTDVWVVDPPLIVPRPMTVNRPVLYTGWMKNPRTGAKSRMTMVMIVTKTGLTADVPPGTFSDCIKSRFLSYSEGTSRDSATLLCRGRGETLTWVNKIKDTADPVQETQNSWSSRLVQSGSANPPFP